MGMVNTSEDINVLLNSIEELANSDTGFSEIDSENHMIAKLLEDVVKTVNSAYKIKLSEVKSKECASEKVTSVGIFKDNLKFMDQLQQEAKKNYFFLSKEHIVNLALLSLKEKYLIVNDVKKLVDCFYQD